MAVVSAQFSDEHFPTNSNSCKVSCRVSLAIDVFVDTLPDKLGVQVKFKFVVASKSDI